MRQFCQKAVLQFYSLTGKGTGHAVMMAKEFIQENIDSDIVVLNADAPFVKDRVLRESLDQHRTEDAKITVITAKLDHPTGYGRLIRSTEDDKVVTAIVEEKDATEEQRAIKEVIPVRTGSLQSFCSGTDQN